MGAHHNAMRGIIVMFYKILSSVVRVVED